VSASDTSTGGAAAAEAEDVEPAARPTLRIVRGDATPEEIAALVAVLSARSGAGEAPVRPARVAGGWSDPARLARRPLLRGPGAWRASAWS
jgi:hypothetical protein